MFIRPGGRDIFTPQLFSFYIWTRKATAHLMHISALGLTSLTALLATSSSRDSTKSLTTSWSSPRSRGLTLRISWLKMPRGSSHSGLHQGYAPAMRSLCCQRSVMSRTPISKHLTTSPSSSWAKDWHTNCKMQNSELRPNCTRWWVAESAGKMLLRQIYEGLCEFIMARTPCNLTQGDITWNWP